MVGFFSRDNKDIVIYIKDKKEKIINEDN